MHSVGFSSELLSDTIGLLAACWYLVRLCGLQDAGCQRAGNTAPPRHPMPWAGQQRRLQL